MGDSKYFVKNGWMMKSSGIGVDRVVTKICREIRLRGPIRDGEGHGWGRVVAFIDADGTEKQMLVDDGTIFGRSSEDAVKRLIDAGLPMATRAVPDVANILGELQGAKARRLIRTKQTGWSLKTGEFVTGARIYGEKSEGESAWYEGSPQSGFQFAVKGSSADWHAAFARTVETNSRLTLAVVFALAAPLLREFGLGPVVLNFVGRTSIGKTTMLRLFTSVYGPRSRGMNEHTWSGTMNSIESLCLAHNDCPLGIDELGVTDPDELLKIVYRIGNGVTKGRADKNGDARAKHSFVVGIMSTSELGITQILGEKTHGGLSVRCLDVPAEPCPDNRLGVFEDLGVWASSAELVEHIRSTTEAVYGAIGDHWLEQLAAMSPATRDAIKKAVASLVEDFLERFAKDVSSEAGRVAKTFAHIAAIGVAAVTFTKTLHLDQGAIIENVGLCFQAWLTQFGGGDGSSRQERQIIENLRDHIETNTHRFQPNRPSVRSESPHVPSNRIGWTTHAADGSIRTYLVPKKVLATATAGHNVDTVVRVLQRRGLLDCDEGRNQKSVRIIGEGSRKMYAIRAELLSGEDGNESEMDDAEPQPAGYSANHLS